MCELSRIPDTVITLRPTHQSTVCAGQSPLSHRIQDRATTTPTGDPTEDHSTVDRAREHTRSAPPRCATISRVTDVKVARTILAEQPDTIYLSIVQVCNLFNIPRGTWTGWVTKGYAPPKDYEAGGSPLWKLTTLVEYARNAPGGRLGYPVG